MLVGANCSTNLRHYDCERPNIAHGPSPPHAEAPPVVATVVVFAEWSVLFLACAVSWRWVASRRAASCWRTGLGGRVLTRCMVPLPLSGILENPDPRPGVALRAVWLVRVREGAVSEGGPAGLPVYGDRDPRWGSPCGRQVGWLYGAVSLRARRGVAHRPRDASGDWTILPVDGLFTMLDRTMRPAGRTRRTAGSSVQMCNVDGES